MNERKHLKRIFWATFIGSIGGAAIAVVVFALNALIFNMALLWGWI